MTWLFCRKKTVVSALNSLYNPGPCRAHGMNRPERPLPDRTSSPRRQNLETLFEAIVGKAEDEIEQPTNTSALDGIRTQGGDRKPLPRPATLLSSKRTVEWAFPATTEGTDRKPANGPPPQTEARTESDFGSTPWAFPLGPNATIPNAITEDDIPIVGVDLDGASNSGWLRIFRTSPWPVIVLVAIMALVTVSAIGLRGGSSTKTEPPPVVTPAETQPQGYSAQAPVAPRAADQPLAPTSTALADASSSSATPAAIVAKATEAPAAVVPTPAPAKTPAERPPAAVPIQKAAATPEPTAAAVAPAPRATEPVPAPRNEPVRVIEAPAAPPPPPEARVETPPAATAPAAISSPRPAAPTVASEPVPELPKPAASRTMVPVVAARRLTGGMPEYLPALRQQRITGIVEVQMRIDINGRVVSAVAVSGPPPLRQAAEAAVLQWRYAPATRNGIPIETESRVSFSFDPNQSRRQ